MGVSDLLLGSHFDNSLIYRKETRHAPGFSIVCSCLEDLEHLPIADKGNLLGLAHHRTDHADDFDD
ncbi:MAG: hypothetical protein MSA55_05005, partial [Coriobacteriaceae bacterium]|nr:hypothetical protein [Coriobacteriaceae bacterium]